MSYTAMPSSQSSFSFVKVTSLSASPASARAAALAASMVSTAPAGRDCGFVCPAVGGCCPDASGRSPSDWDCCPDASGRSPSDWDCCPDASGWPPSGWGWPSAVPGCCPLGSDCPFSASSCPLPVCPWLEDAVAPSVPRAWMLTPLTSPVAASISYS